MIAQGAQHNIIELSAEMQPTLTHIFGAADSIDAESSRAVGDTNISNGSRQRPLPLNGIQLHISGKPQSGCVVPCCGASKRCRPSAMTKMLPYESKSRSHSISMTGGASQGDAELVIDDMETRNGRMPLRAIVMKILSPIGRGNDKNTRRLGVPIVF
jgi:hypothetical protein